MTIAVEPIGTVRSSRVEVRNDDWDSEQTHIELDARFGTGAVDGTPVLDIKPWVRELGPRGDVKQPAWMDALMCGYWS